MKIYQVETDEYKEHIKEIFHEYMHWQLQMFNQTYNFDLGEQELTRIIANDMRRFSQYLPPQGHLFLVEVDGHMAGVGGLRPLSEDAWEVKRIYVKPDYRGRGIGKRLLETLISTSQQHNVSFLRLDSAKFLTSAHKLFYALGFENIERYAGAESPTEFTDYFLYMELELKE